MIDKKELRYGNLVILAHESNAPVGTIKEIHTSYVILQEYELGNPVYSLIMPIELTPEWLERLGFKKGYCDEMEGYMRTFGGRVTFFLVKQPYTNGTFGFLSFIETNVGMGVNSICLNPPEYVHQLMNLVYDFTGEELESFGKPAGAAKET